MRRACYLLGALLALAFLLTACGANNGGTPKSVSLSKQHVRNAGSATSTPVPKLVVGSQPCPHAVSVASYWNPLIPTQASVSRVESVTCAYLKGTSNLQALVMVRYLNTGSPLDVYVYDNLSAANPTQIFKLQNLYQGAAKISPYNTNTLLTAEVDRASSMNHNQPQSALKRDLFREFKWSPDTNTFVQVNFPGIFPDLTRYQAENDQSEVNQGHTPWKLSATETAQSFGASLLQWDPHATATLVSGGGSGAANAVVKLRDTVPGSDTITLTMNRLEGNTSNGIWIVTAAATNGLSITQPQTGSLIRSSTTVTVTGTGSAFEGVIGKVTILDHLYADIGQATAHGAIGNGQTTFSASVTAQPTFTNGAEEGLVMLTEENNAGGGSAGTAIVKVLIQQ